MAITIENTNTGMGATGVEGGESTPPEQELFHAAYIGYQARENHINIIEEAGKIHIRGVQYNLDELNMIIILSKKIQVKTSRHNNQDRIDCFSFQSGELPYKGTSGNVCGLNKNERAMNPFCEPCKSQIIVCGIYCDATGNPIKDDDQKPIFIFIRGKGMKYMNVSNHLRDLYKLEVPSILADGASDAEKEYEKQHFNQSRVVTKLTRGIEKTQYGGTANVFKCEIGPQLPDKAAETVIGIGQKMIDKFIEKFDWSKSRAGQQASAAAAAGTSYGGAQPNADQTFGDAAPKTQGQQQDDIPFGHDTPTETKKEEPPKPSGQVSEAQVGFDDINF